MSTELAVDGDAERATLGAIMITGDARVASGLAARGLRPHHFYYERHGSIFQAAVSLADKQKQNRAHEQPGDENPDRN